MANVRVTSLRFDHHPDTDPLGIGTAEPRLSWSFAGEAKNWKQTGYEIEICKAGQAGNKQVHGDKTDGSLFIAWPSTPLKSRETATVRVKATGTGDKGDSTTEWTKQQNVEAGLLQRSDWSAKFVTSTQQTPKDKPHRPILFRSPVFQVETKDKVSGSNKPRARLYITALGVYEAHINGTRVGDLQMAPGWTSYNHRLPYQVFDVTDYLDWSSQNVLGVEVAEGWYAGRLTWVPGVRNVYGSQLGVLAQLEIQNPDGSIIQQVISDESWSAHPSSLVTSELYDGEVYDMRDDLPGHWKVASFDQGESWNKASVLDFGWDKVSLISPDVPAVRVTENVRPKKIFRSKSGKTLVDFGQNLVGKIQILKALHFKEGHSVTLRHAEVLENGELGTRPLRSAGATDTIVFGNGSTLKDWTPRFTFHGFRYLELNGWTLDDTDSPPTTDNIVALVMHSDMARTGYFDCSNSLVNQIHSNVVWSMRGNFLSVPTDCPQRDERLGWTGDIQVFSPTASFLYSSAGLLANWLQDLAVDQNDTGGIVPVVIPDVLTGRSSWPNEPQAVWDDVAIILPWVIYQWTGDVDVLRRQLPSMQTYIDKSIRRDPRNGLLWDPTLWQLGDWLDPNAPPSEPGLARTDGTLVADAYLVYVTGLMAKISTVVGDETLSDKYQNDHARLKAAFQDTYVASSGLVVSDSQTALALALCFSLHSSPDQIRNASDRLARLVKYSKYRVSTGFAGTPLVLHALSQNKDHVQLAYRMLLEKECPSWLYPVSMGATTTWERWDSMLPDGTINPGEMTSFNHYALGSVASWLHEVVGGINMLEPGWKKFRVAPVPGGDLTNVDLKFESPIGSIAVKWNISEGRSLRLIIDVPPNTEALIVLPGQKDDGEGSWVGSGRYEYDVSYEAPGKWPPRAILTQFREEDE
ncbi:hypothetical protein J7T55_015353 [Diaporthe amygdali]|uniref:uncharacterized protein n=1 Tax=Phomopsis amygdali TaxID=1214568 RepID=UPI0022FDE584|nr:uncharacterized protein J7T55_015353 [Diaporthe amygdali]KAJ0120623.1 hypothetical protein J7T55_015353 [Diaporthe amygdali]